MSRRRFSSLQDLASFFGEHCTGRDEPFFFVDDFSALRNAVDGILNRMPSIGFLSPRRRLRCFMTVCEHLDSLIERGLLTLDDALMALDVLRLESRKFRKAVRMFRRRAAVTDVPGIEARPLVSRCYADSMGCI